MTDNTPSYDDYEQFLSLENFQLAWRRIRNSKRVEVKDRLGLRIYSLKTNSLLSDLISKIRNNEYAPTRPQLIPAPKSKGGVRLFPFLTMTDRLVYQAIGNILIKNTISILKEFESKEAIFASVPNHAEDDFVFKRGSNIDEEYLGQYVKYLTVIEREGNNYNPATHQKWIVETDIAGFYHSIEHLALVKTLSENGWITSESLIQLLLRGLSEWALIQAEIPLSQGIPVGYETSDVLANLYLLDIDVAISNYGKMFRYVDDMTIFASNRSQAIFAFSQLDLFLQQKGLTVNSSKTIISPYSEQAQKYRNKIALSKRLDALDEALEGNSEQVAIAQFEMRNLLYELYYNLLDKSHTSLTNELNSLTNVNYEVYEGEFAFLLYRIKGVDNTVDHEIKAIALQLLEALPKRSTAITHYLLQYVEDGEVIKKLTEIVENVYAPVQLRANCLRALVAVTYNTDFVTRIAIDWCDDKHEWYLRLIGTEILQNYETQRDSLLAIASQEEDENIRASAYIASYQLKTVETEKEEVLTAMLIDTSLYVNIAGVYLWETQVDATWEYKIPPSINSEIEPLIREAQNSLAHYNESELFKRAIEEFCGVNLGEELPIEEVFGDLQVATQFISEMISANKSGDRHNFLVAAHNFTYELVVAHLGNPPQMSDTLSDLLSQLDDNISRPIWDLLYYYNKIPNSKSGASVLSSPIGVVLDVDELRNLVNTLISVYVYIFVEIFTTYGKAHPTSLIEKLERIKGKIRALLFISHKTENDGVIDKIDEELKKHTFTTWIDHVDIHIGDDWDEEITKALNKCDAMLLALTPEALDSASVKVEWNYYLEERKPIYPILLAACKTPPRLRGIQFIDFSGDFDVALQKLIKQLKHKHPLK